MKALKECKPAKKSSFQKKKQLSIRQLLKDAFYEVAVLKTSQVPEIYIRLRNRSFRGQVNPPPENKGFLFDILIPRMN